MSACQELQSRPPQPGKTESNVRYRLRFLRRSMRHNKRPYSWQRNQRDRASASSECFCPPGKAVSAVARYDHFRRETGEWVQIDSDSGLLGSCAGSRDLRYAKTFPDRRASLTTPDERAE